jgi:hypothetical protein
VADDLAVEHDLAAGRPVEAAEQLQQRALARAGRPHQGHELAAPDLQRNTAEGIDVAVAEPVALGQIAGFEDRPAVGLGVAATVGAGLGVTVGLGVAAQVKEKRTAYSFRPSAAL